MFVDQSSGRQSSFSAAVVKGVWFATAVSLSLAVAIPLTAADPKTLSESERLVAAAVQAEVAGDVGQYLTLLQAAIRSDPNNKVARWQLGQVQVGRDWIPAEEAQRRSANDPLQAEYRQRRAAASDSLADQIRLARWCRDNKLNDEAELHWTVVLSHDPTNKEAQRAVDMLWKGGRLVNRKQSTDQKRQVQAAKDAAKYWEPMIAKWRRAVAGRDARAHDAALAEIRAIDRLDAIPSIEAVTLGRDAYQSDHAEECQQIAVAFMEALVVKPYQAATQSIVRHAVLSPGNKVKKAAIAELKKRDQHEYVPMLLAGLAMPIESSYQVMTDLDGAVHYRHSLYREAADADWEWDANYSVMRRPGHVVDVYFQRVNKPVLVDRAASAKRAWMVPSPAIVRTVFADFAANVEFSVDKSNKSVEQINAQVIPVLAATSGKDHSTAKQWWDWWRDANEYYESDHPLNRNSESQSNGDCFCRPQPSCFVRGTRVWTKMGLIPIETVELGDFVLSQDVNTGELTYKPVLAKTVRPPSKMLTITLDGDVITTTLGHPFWVAGTGWRMAKELGDDARLHGINGANRVRSISSAADAEAYNLVVADYSTYFVGDSGVLVHDNTPRQPSQAIVPGVGSVVKK